jgi:hypothetical protein
LRRRRFGKGLDQRWKVERPSKILGREELHGVD